MFLVVAPFESDAKHNVKAIGMPKVSVKPLNESQIAGLTPENIKKAGKEGARLAIEGLTKATVIEKKAAALPKIYTFKGRSSGQAQEAMEKYFLNRMMSDGFQQSMISLP